MVSIVGVHCAGGVFGTLHKGTPELLKAIIIPLKFGTIAFFLISGFLLGERFETGKRSEYLRRRLGKVLLPWLFWFCLQVAYFSGTQVYAHGSHVSFDFATVCLLTGLAGSCLFSTSFWFVPNLLLAICVLMTFRKHLRDLRFGAVLLAVNIFYAINIYTLWLPSSHTVALFGFIFYLWLGAFAARHYKRLNSALSRVSIHALLALAAFTCVMCFAESRVLERLHSPDPMNTLRLTNQIFSVTVVLLMMKLPYQLWPRFVDAGNEMFCVYLAQTLSLSVLASAMKRILPKMPGVAYLGSNIEFVSLWTVMTGIVLLSCIVLSKVFGRRKVLSWAVGKTFQVPLLPVTSVRDNLERDVLHVLEGAESSFGQDVKTA